jgi:hypothetical protein
MPRQSPGSHFAGTLAEQWHTHASTHVAVLSPFQVPEGLSAEKGELRQCQDCMQAFEDRMQGLLEARELPGCSDEELARLRHLIDD